MSECPVLVVIWLLSKQKIALCPVSVNNQASVAANVDVKERAELWSKVHCSRIDSLPMDTGNNSKLYAYIQCSQVSDGIGKCIQPQLHQLYNNKSNIIEIKSKHLYEVKI